MVFTVSLSSFSSSLTLAFKAVFSALSLSWAAEEVFDTGFLAVAAAFVVLETTGLLAVEAGFFAVDVFLAVVVFFAVAICTPLSKMIFFNISYFKGINK